MRRWKQTKESLTAQRITLVGVLFFVAGGVVLARLFFLQVLQHDFFVALAEGQHSFEEVIVPERGEIFVRDRSRTIDDQLVPVAVNREWPMVYAVPKEIENPETVVPILSSLLELDEEEFSSLQERLGRKNDPFEPVAHRVDDDVAESLKKMAIPGIYIRSERLRYYPEGDRFAHILGFLGFRGDDRVGQYGVEEYYEEQLAGSVGLLRGERSVRGIPLIFNNGALEEARDGADIILSVDPNIQFFVSEKLRETVSRLSAESGSIVVMNPQTGKILALAVEPSFDLNAYGDVEDINQYLNPVVHDRFEPGSIIKPFSMAAALEKGALGPQDRYTDTGSVRLGGYTIHNADGLAHGEQTMTEVLELSLNTGAVYMQQQAGKRAFRDTLQAFGFGEKTRIDLTGEADGDLANLDRDRDIEYATASFGQGIAVTPIEIVRAFAAIANGGFLVHPSLADSIISSDGESFEIDRGEPDRILKQTTASVLSSMLVSVVDNGFGRKAAVSGYDVAGKTGTAQIPDPEAGGYLEGETIHSFAGFAPAQDPEFVMLLTVHRPSNIRFSSDSVAPTWGEIAKFILQYLEVPPTR